MTWLQRFIEALSIFDRHDPNARTGAEHDEFYVYGKGLDVGSFTEDELRKLAECGFEWEEDVDGWRRFT